ncbi:hypothetical protein DUI87_25185 [Hirundo rustica rustica]|uniref:Uncharacterized protein n=1 Tax=Hirundo rustica rustica TaxID=333673 RepID=A0A3M0JDA8_HIRRU|nr:hypothetical protein DUI87_25185 [Hirundo rustica rustica]
MMRVRLRLSATTVLSSRATAGKAEGQVLLQEVMVLTLTIIIIIIIIRPESLPRAGQAKADPQPGRLSAQHLRVCSAVKEQ